MFRSKHVRGSPATKRAAKHRRIRAERKQSFASAAMEVNCASYSLFTSVVVPVFVRTPRPRKFNESHTPRGEARFFSFVLVVLVINSSPALLECMAGQSRHLQAGLASSRSFRFGRRKGRRICTRVSSCPTIIALCDLCPGEKGSATNGMSGS